MGLGSITGLRTEAQQAFERMKQAAQNEGITLNIVSGYRSFNEQLTLWNNKFDSLGNSLSEQEKIRKVAEFTAIPGMSRHHFGTEIDINSVNPADFTGSGKQVAAYNWLRNNTKKFGFCQPYEQDRLVKTEPWHWSHKEISKDLTTQHINSVSSSDLQGKGIKGEATIISNFGSYHRGFISDINPECLS